MRATSGLLALAGACLLYVAAYLILSQPKENGMSVLTTYYYDRTPSYWLGGRTAETLFAPMQWFDERVRPSYWHGVSKLDLQEFCIPLELEEKR
jgi:hypothetical protein